MKARVRGEKKLKNQVCLSIGMIVKNEEKGLEECLRALTPLREAVSCELIIADTGSTDRTLEIAQKYADTLLQIPWNGDFGAARNVTLDHATGEWFFYIDADEILDADCRALIHFLQSNQAKKYNTISLVRYNYTNRTHLEYAISHYERIHRRTPQNRFTQKIHESLESRLPIRQLNTIVYHTGYEREVIGEKRLRNRMLLEQEPKPEDVRYLHALSDTYGMEPQELGPKKALLLKILDLEEHLRNFQLYFAAATTLARVYLYEKDDAQVEQLAKRYFQTLASQPPFASDMEMYYYHGASLQNQKKFEQAIEPLLQYQKMYQQYQAGKLNTAELSRSVLLVASTPYWIVSNYMLAQCYVEQDDNVSAYSCLEQTGTLDMLPDEKQELALYIELLYAAESGDISRLAALYETVLQQKNQTLCAQFSQLFAKRYAKLAPALNSFFSNFSEQPCARDCLHYLRLLVFAWSATSDQPPEQRFPLLFHYIHWAAYFCSLLFHAEFLKAQNRDLLPAEHQFILEALDALAYYECQDLEQYFHALQALLEKYPARHEEIAVLLLPVNQQQEQQRKQQAEFEQLAQSVKETFYTALLSEQREQAQLILDNYRQIHPSDPEIAMMRIALISPKEALLQ